MAWNKDKIKEQIIMLENRMRTAKSEKEWWETALSDLKDQFNYNEITVDQYINSLQNLLGKVGNTYFTPKQFIVIQMN